MEKRNWNMKKFVIGFSIFLFIIIYSVSSKNYYDNIDNEELKPKQNYNYSQSVVDDYSETVYITRTGSCYHVGYCSHAKNPTSYMTKNEAKNRGYRACSYCCY